jgi:hypothetical protein
VLSIAPQNSASMAGTVGGGASISTFFLGFLVGAGVDGSSAGVDNDSSIY